MNAPIFTSNVPDPRSEIQHAPLRQRAFHQLGYVASRVPNVAMRYASRIRRRCTLPEMFQPPRHAKPVEKAGNRVVDVCADLRVGDTGDGGVRGGGVVEDS